MSPPPTPFCWPGAGQPTATIVRYQDETWARFWALGPRILWPPALFSSFPAVQAVLDLGFLSVAREWRGRGVAGELMARAAGMARALGCQVGRGLG